MEDMEELFELMRAAEQSIAESVGKPDWTYRDLPRMTPETLNQLVMIIGEENIDWITHASYDDGSVRGQILISPLGMAALGAYNSTRQ